MVAVGSLLGHNERDGVSNHRRLYCLLNHLLSRRSKKTSKLRDTSLCEGNSRVNAILILSNWRIMTGRILIVHCRRLALAYNKVVWKQLIALISITARYLILYIYYIMPGENCLYMTVALSLGQRTFSTYTIKQNIDQSDHWLQLVLAFLCTTLTLFQEACEKHVFCVRMPW